MQQTLSLTLALFWLSLFSVCLLIGRLAQANFFDTWQIHSPSSKFLFLLWNLFLAWIPYGISILTLRLKKSQKTIFSTTTLLLIWLFFWPNAPYLMTDLVHFKHHAAVPFWYDLILLSSFACTGLFLGVFSFMHIQKVIRPMLNTYGL